MLFSFNLRFQKHRNSYISRRGKESKDCEKISGSLNKFHCAFNESTESEMYSREVNSTRLLVAAICFTRERKLRGSTDLYSCLRQADLHGELLPKNKKESDHYTRKKEPRPRAAAGVFARASYLILLLR